MDALLTDLYQLTMASAYQRAGLAEREAVFHLFFRRAPSGGGFAIAAGLEPALERIERLRFEADDLAFLATLTGPGGTPLFTPAFLEALSRTPPALDVDAVPEGSAVLPGEPLVRVRGPLLQAQLVESALLNRLNFETLVATTARRIVAAAGGSPVVEFGLRRAHGPDGALGASRAAWIGGVSATSNVLAARTFGIPVRGTHAHSFVMAFDSEAEAFEAWADANPAGAIFLVDTSDTIGGVRAAIDAGRRLRSRGGELAGIRLDSGDLEALSREARRMLDDAGFRDAAILAGNDLDAKAIRRLRREGAPIDVFAVGTRLVTGAPDAALGGVYKLGAIRDAGGRWRFPAKRSNDPAKASTPGVLQVRRSVDRDVLWDETLGTDAAGADLLRPAMRGGRRLRPAPPLAEARIRAAAARARRFEVDPSVAARAMRSRRAA